MLRLPPRVFISYHHDSAQSADFARKLYDNLTLAGSKPFFDKQSIKPGDDWARRIYTELFRCDAAVILLSQSGLDTSAWLRHESSILVDRLTAWGDVVIVPVMIDVDIEVLRRDSEFKTLSRIQCATLNDHGLEEVTSTLKEQWRSVFVRMRRHRLIQSLLGVPQRAQWFQTAIIPLLPATSILRATIHALSLPVPPTDTEVDLRWFMAGLLLAHNKADQIIDVFRRQGASKEASALEGYLGRRGLRRSTGRLGISLTRRFLWGLRNWALAGMGGTLLLTVLLQEAALRAWQHPGEPGAAFRAFGIALTFSLVFGPLITVIARLLLFTIRRPS